MALRTPVCALLGIEHPIVLASLGPWSTPRLCVAASEAGILGSLGSATKPIGRFMAELDELRTLTDRPFAVNHTMRPLDEEAFELSLEYRPKVVSMAIGARADLVERAHEAGAVFVQQVHTRRQAAEAAGMGVDVLIAQGGEAGGFSGTVSALTLIPQVVEEVDPLPVLAAGGIGDGRGIAAALVLGAQGVNMGTRFLASEEAGVSERWQQAILDAESEDPVKAEFAGQVLPPPGPGGYSTLPRTLPTEFVEEWNGRLGEVPEHLEELRDEVGRHLAAGTIDELIPFTGQSTGMIRDIKPVAAIVADLLEQADQALRRAAA